MSILNLPHWQVHETQENKHDYRIIAGYLTLPKKCLHCQSDRISRNGTRKALFMDVPVHGKRVGIEVSRQRYVCQVCKKTFSQPLPDINDKRDATNRLVKYIRDWSLRRTFASVADEVGVAENTVKNIFEEYVQELEKEHKPKTPEWLGIDEIHIIRKPRCVLANIKENTIFDFLVNRNKPLLAKRLEGLQRHNIEIVTMDMWLPYKDVVAALIPDAAIVIDKFHVIRMANVAMDSVRKFVRKDLTPKQRRTLIKDRFLLLKRTTELDPFQALIVDGWSKQFPLLGEAYQLKEAFFGIYDSTNKIEAVNHYENWKKIMSSELKPFFEPLLKAMENWHNQIFSYFDHNPRVTNAFTESLNNLIRHVNRNGRGYSFEALRAKLLYGVGASRYERPVYQRTNWNKDFMGLIVEQPTMFLGATVSTLNQLYEQGEI